MTTTRTIDYADTWTEFVKDGIWVECGDFSSGDATVPFDREAAHELATGCSGYMKEWDDAEGERHLYRVCFRWLDEDQGEEGELVELAISVDMTDSTFKFDGEWFDL